jgi:hypothetical protein
MQVFKRCILLEFLIRQELINFRRLGLAVGPMERWRVSPAIRSSLFSKKVIPNDHSFIDFFEARLTMISSSYRANSDPAVDIGHHKDVSHL